MISRREILGSLVAVPFMGWIGKEKAIPKEIMPIKNGGKKHPMTALVESYEEIGASPEQIRGYMSVAEKYMKNHKKLGGRNWWQNWGNWWQGRGFPIGT